MPPIQDCAVPVRAVTEPPYQHFFGYYEKTPWDVTGQYLLAHRTRCTGPLPGASDVAEVGVIDLWNGNTFIPLAETTAWNWQQGAMAQWLSIADRRVVLFNTRENDRDVSVLVDLDTRARHTLPLSVYAAAPDGKTALSIDFTWLGHARPGYGHASTGAAHLDTAEGGIFALDLESSAARRILSHDEIFNFKRHPVMQGAVHWVEHLLVNPTSTRFLFLHRFQSKSGTMYTRLLTANLDGSDLCVLLQGSVSHYCWYSPQEILIWARQRSFDQQIRTRSLINRLPLKRVLLRWLGKQRGWVRQNVIGDSLHLLTDQTNEFRIVGQGIITEDGHPSVSPDGRWILMDTYPDEKRYQHLFLYDCRHNQRIPLGSFYSPPDFTQGYRCDLHPRWSRDGGAVCIDSANTGSRQMYILDVSEITG